MSRQHRYLRKHGINPFDVIEKKVHAPSISLRQAKAMVNRRKKQKGMLTSLIESFKHTEKKTETPRSFAKKSPKKEGFISRIKTFFTSRRRGS